MIFFVFFGFDTKSKGTKTKNKQARLHQTKKLMHRKGNHPQIQIRQIQIKTTMRHHQLEWLLSKRQKITKIGEDVEKRENMCTVCGTINWCIHYGKEHGGSSKN